MAREVAEEAAKEAANEAYEVTASRTPLRRGFYFWRSIPVAQNCPVDTDLTSVVAALAELNDGELAALIDAANKAPQIAPEMLAWIEGVCDWELYRRRGLDYPLLPPEAAGLAQSVTGSSEATGALTPEQF